MCCTALEIPEFNKPAGPACENCIASGGCKIYTTRPQLCRDFECEWLTERTLPTTLRPDRVGTILMEADDTDEYRAVCSPKPPQRLAPSAGLRPSGAHRQDRSHRGGQSRPQLVADFRLRRMGADHLSKAPIL